MPTCSSPRPQRNLNSVASETKLSVPRFPRSPLGSKIFLTDGGSGPGGQYLFAGMKLRFRSLSHLEGGPNPEQESQKPECAPLSSSPASGRGLEEAAPRLSHSVVQNRPRQRLRCCGCCYRGQTAGKKGREIHRGRMQGAGLASVTSLRLRQGRPSFLLPPFLLLPTSPWQPPPLCLRAGGAGTTRCSAAHLRVSMAAAAAGSRRVGVRAPGDCNRPNRRAQSSFKGRGGSILQAIATKFMFSTALSAMAYL